MIVSDLLQAGFRIAGISQGPNRTLSASELAEGLNVLNAMLDAWNTERMMIYELSRSLFNLQAGVGAYNIGPGATFNATRPLQINDASINFLGNPTIPIELPIAILTYQEWQAVRAKNIPSAIPLNMWYDAKYPNGIINLWPVPTDNTNQLILYLWNQLAQFAAATDNVALPPGYVKAIEYNLGVELNARWPQAPMLRPQVMEIAAETKGWVKTVNTPILDMICDPAVLGSGGRYNIFTDTFGGSSGSAYGR